MTSSEITGQWKWWLKFCFRHRENWLNSTENKDLFCVFIQENDFKVGKNGCNKIDK